MTKPEESTIGHLLEEAQQKPEAQNQLLAECRSYLVVLARMQLRGHLQAKVDASDIAQQTLLEAHQDFEKFRGQTPAEWLAWLRKLLKNNLTNVARGYQTKKRQASREVSLAPSRDSERGFRLSQLPGQGETPSQIIRRKEQELLLADALEKLSPEHREVIVLRNLQRLPFEDVAQQMNRTRPATQMLWMRAMEKLQSVLSQMDDSSIAWRMS